MLRVGRSPAWGNWRPFHRSTGGGCPCLLDRGAGSCAGAVQGSTRGLGPRRAEKGTGGRNGWWPAGSFDDVVGPASKLALPLRGGVPVLGIHEVGRGHLLPGGRPDRLPGHLHALPSEVVCRLRLDLGVAIPEERVHQQLGVDPEGAGVGIDVEERGRAPSPNSDRLCPTSGR